MTEIRFETLPSTDGATQTRTVAVSVTAPGDGGVEVGTVTIGIDATQNGQFRELTTDENGGYVGGRTNTQTFQPFIGATPPYDLRASVTFDSASDDEDATATATETIRDFGEDRRGEEIDAPDVSELSGDASEKVEVTPRVGPVEPITMTARYQIPWERDTNQTACGETIQRQNGDLDWRIVFEGVLTLSQLTQLRGLRDSSGRVETRSAVFGVKDVTFDQLNVERPDEEKVAEIDGVTEPLYQFQLQTKELDDENGLFGDS